MRKYIVKRLLLAIPTMLGAITVLWFAMQLAPGDPALMFVPPDFQGEEAEAYLAKVNELYGFNDPLPVQYLRYMRNTLQGDFGELATDAAPGVGGSAAPHPQFFAPGDVGLSCCQRPWE